jgi:hypothetical protein
MCRYAVFEVCHSLTRITLCTNIFPVNLTEICQTAMHESDYEHLPLLGMSLHLFTRLLLILPSATGVPDMASLRNEFCSIGSTQHGPYFRGYCGEHKSEYQGTTQLAGAPLGRLLIYFIHLFNSQPL